MATDGTHSSGKVSKTGKKVQKDAVEVFVVSFRYLLRETVNGLAPMIWFYPLNDLEISGYEAFAALWFLQMIAGSQNIRSLLQHESTMCVLRGIMVASLASFQAPSTLYRLAILAFGNGIATLTLTLNLWSPCQRIRWHTSLGLLLGLVAFIASRIWFVSFVPTWWTSQSNSVVVAIGAVAVVDQFITGFDRVDSTSSKVSKTNQPFTIPTALGFGSLLYLLNWVFGESSLTCRWVVRPYPQHGPDPYPWGALTFFAVCMGGYLSTCRHVATSKVWWMIGLIAFGSLYYLPTWQGYIGGLVLAVYALSIWPEMTDRVSRCPPARTLFLAILMFMIQNFFLVWTVAYNFVPGGVYTRERTDVLIILNMVSIFVGLFFGGKTEDEGYTSYVTVRKKKVSTGNFNKILTVIMCIGLLGYGYRYNPDKHSHPVKKAPKDFTAAIWTYHFGYDNRGWPSLERTAILLNDTGADVITLLESDASKPFLGNNDLGMWLEEKLGFYVDFGPSTKDHTWGNLILSKYPFVKSKHHLLPSPHESVFTNQSNLNYVTRDLIGKMFVRYIQSYRLEGELAPAVTATVNMSGSLVDFVVTHMGNDRDVLDRKLQSKFLAKELRESENPVVFLGYVTSKPYSKEYEELIDGGNVKDIDETDRKRFCEYIMYRGLIRLGYARVTHGGLSDTEVQMARFSVPNDPSNYEDNSKVTYNTDKIPSHVLFNSKFGDVHHGHGYFRGHHFHMSTPKYFLP